MLRLSPGKRSGFCGYEQLEGNLPTRNPYISVLSALTSDLHVDVSLPRAACDFQLWLLLGNGDDLKLEMKSSTQIFSLHFGGRVLSLKKSQIKKKHSS